MYTVRRGVILHEAPVAEVELPVPGDRPEASGVDELDDGGVVRSELGPERELHARRRADG